MLHRKPLPARTLALLLPVAAAACTVGPNYAGPPDVAPVSTAAGKFHRADVAPVDPAPAPARWWDGMGDPELVRLIDMAFAASPTLKVAQARILEARANLSQQRAGLYPSGTATALAAKARIPTGSLSEIGNALGSSGATGGTAVDIPKHYTVDLYSVGFDAMWEIDLFGGTRRGIEGARAQTEAAAARYEDAQVQLAAEVGQAYINLRDVQQRLALNRQASALQNRMLALTLDKRGLGTADDLDVERLRAQIKQTDASTVPLVGQVEQAVDQLSMLVGREPGALDAELTPPRPLPMPPERVAIGDPAAMLRRRPDIRAAERQLVASNAAIGQAVAQLFPTITLIGTVGLSSTSASDLFSTRNLSAIGAPFLRWNFLNFGQTRAKIRQARASNEESLAQYQSTVLSALQDAESSLSRFGHQRENVVQLAEARDSAARSARLATIRYQGGTATFIDALDAERQRLQAEQSLSQARGQLSNDYISLQKSLGLGWLPAGATPPDQPAGTAR